MRLLLLLALAVPVAAQVPPADSARVLYSQNRMAEALAIAQRAAAAEPEDADLRALLADVLWRIGQDRADDGLISDAMGQAVGVVDEDPCHVPALLTLASIQGDADPGSASEVLDQAVRCAPDDGNVWLGVWTHAARSGHQDREAEALLALDRAGFWAPPMQAFAAWTLRAAPRDAILLANGVRDGAAIRTLQVADGLRPDVTTVPVALLDGVDLVASLEAAGLPVPDDARRFEPRVDPRGSSDTSDGRLYTLADAVVDGWLTRDRPVVGAITLNPLVLGTKGGVVDRGALLAPGPASFDAGAAADSFRGLDPAAFAGPAVTDADRDPAARTSAFDPGGIVLFQMLQTAVSYAQDGAPDQAEAVYRQAVSFAQGSGRSDEPLVPVAREWIDDALTATDSP